MAITTGTHPKLLWPGLWDIWHEGMYESFPNLWEPVFQSENSNMHFEEIKGVTSFGLAPVKTQGAALINDTEMAGYLQRFTHVAYALGFVVTKEEMADNLYAKVGKTRSRMLAKSMRETIEVVNWAHFNNAFDSSAQTWADGKELIATDHPFVEGGTWANELASDVDLSEAALEDMMILMRKWVNGRGLRINAKEVRLIIPPDYEFDAIRILRSTLQNDTDLNAVNALRGRFPQGIHVVPYLTDTDAWFIQTNVDLGFMHFWRTRPEFETDNDFNTKNKLHSGYERFSSGVVDPHCVLGSQGS